MLIFFFWNLTGEKWFLEIFLFEHVRSSAGIQLKKSQHFR